MDGLKGHYYVTHFPVADLLQAESKPELPIRFLDGYFCLIHGKLVEADTSRITGAVARVRSHLSFPGQTVCAQVGLSFRCAHRIDVVHVLQGIQGGRVFSVAGLHTVEGDDVAVDPTEQGHAGTGDQHQGNNGLYQGEATLLAVRTFVHGLLSPMAGLHSGGSNCKSSRNSFGPSNVIFPPLQMPLKL